MLSAEWKTFREILSDILNDTWICRNILKNIDSDKDFETAYVIL